jgi:hypothetical protein
MGEAATIQNKAAKNFMGLKLLSRASGPFMKSQGFRWQLFHASTPIIQRDEEPTACSRAVKYQMPDGNILLGAS